MYLNLLNAPSVAEEKWIDKVLLKLLFLKAVNGLAFEIRQQPVIPRWVGEGEVKICHGRQSFGF